MNRDSAAQSSELLEFTNYSRLVKGDSLEFQYSFEGFETGSHAMIVVIEFPEDENPLDNISLLEFKVNSPPNLFNDIVLNEVMYKPAPESPEWVEIYNNTGKNINLKKWRIGDKSSSVEIAYDDLFLPGDNYLVISEGETLLDSFQISSIQIVPNLPAFNNGGDKVILLDSLDNTIDSISYLPNWGGDEGGVSLERKSVTETSDDSANWDSSNDPHGATPGGINSISAKNFDLKILSFDIQGEYGIIGESQSATLKVINNGKSNSGIFSVNIFYDKNKDSTAQIDELILKREESDLAPGEVGTYVTDLDNYESGKNYFMAIVDYSPDEYRGNNISYLNFRGVYINEEKFDLIINEFVYSPAAPEPEWIELFNRSGKIINIKNYYFADNRDTALLINQDLELRSGDFLVMAKDSSIHEIYPFDFNSVITGFPSLNNTSDKIIILDSLKRVIDSLEYQSSWGNNREGSLERIDPEMFSSDSSNWGVSKDASGATPGYINSLTQKNVDLSLEKIIIEPEFPLLNDEVRIGALVKNFGKLETGFTLKIFEDTNADSLGDIFIEESPFQILNSHDSLLYFFNFSITRLNKARSFLIYLSNVEDEDTTNNSKFKNIKPGFTSKTIIINEVMFAPINGEPEWVELYNPNEEEIPLINWSISDVETKPVMNNITSAGSIIKPQSYLIITKDSSLFYYHKEIPSEIIVMDFANLNNDADGIVIRDFNQTVIDSMYYDEVLSQERGKSIERVFPEVPSDAVSNWKMSTDIELSTPGRKNSVTPKKIDFIIESVTTIPKYPVKDDEVYFNAKIKNTGTVEGGNVSVLFYNKRDENYELFDHSEIQYLKELDSTEVSSLIPLQLKDSVHYKIELVSDTDEDFFNNSATGVIKAGYLPNSIVINEIMFNPEDNNPEWIELWNISGFEINIMDWTLLDVSSSRASILAKEEKLIPPDYSILIVSDSVFFEIAENSEIVVLNLPTLGNSADGIAIKDFRGAVMDSLYYKSSWGGEKGYSLERISIAEMTNDSLNWSTSLDFSGGTPGRVNSVVNAASYKYNEVIINEIMFDPVSSNSEFIEIFNTSGKNIDLGGWRLEDESGEFYKISVSSYLLPENGYYILAADSSFLANYSQTDSLRSMRIERGKTLSLSNTGEILVLKDLFGNVIDSVYYSAEMHNENIFIHKNKSLERINPSLASNSYTNWNTSVASQGATPGRKNSIFTNLKESQPGLSIHPNPFSPDNDGFEDYTIIKYELGSKIAQIRIRLFDSIGRLVRTIENNRASGSGGEVIFDGLNDDGNPLKMGIYIVFLEAINTGNNVIETIKSALVVARKL